MARDSFAQIAETLRNAAREVQTRSPERRLHEISIACAVIAQRELLLIQLHAAAACTVPAIRDAVRAGLPKRRAAARAERGR